MISQRSISISMISQSAPFVAVWLVAMTTLVFDTADAATTITVGLTDAIESTVVTDLQTTMVIDTTTASAVVVVTTTTPAAVTTASVSTVSTEASMTTIMPGNSGGSTANSYSSSSSNSNSSNAIGTTASTAVVPIQCSFCGLGSCNTTRPTSAPMSWNTTTTTSSSSSSYLNVTSTSSMTNCTSKTGVCYVLYDKATNAIALGCNSSVSSKTKCTSEWNAANGRCESCCTSSMCNANYASQNVAKICANVLFPSGATGLQTVIGLYHLIWVDAVALLVTTVLTLFGT